METKPIDFNPPTEEARLFLLPVTATLFADRAERFRHACHRPQPRRLAAFSRPIDARPARRAAAAAAACPAAAALEQARAHGMPPLNASALTPGCLARCPAPDLIAQLLPGRRKPPAILKHLLRANDERLEQLADSLLNGEPDAARPPELPFGAALQVVWTALASQLDASNCSRSKRPWRLPLLRQPAGRQRRPPRRRRQQPALSALLAVQQRMERATRHLHHLRRRQGLALHRSKGANGACVPKPATAARAT
jgi:hypothetical protein